MNTNTDPTTRPMPYALTLTSGEYHSLEWLEAHGYAGKLIEAADEIDDSQATEAQGAYGSRYTDGVITLRYSEAAAWDAVGIGEDDPDFGTCAGPELLAKMFAFRDAIV